MRVRRSERRRGLTRIEVVVLVVLIVTGLGLLFALLPRAHESADRVQCQANLRRITAATLRFHDRHHYLPASRIDDSHATWAVLLAPDLTPLADNPLKAWELPKPYADQPAAAREMQIPAFYCPARRQPPQLSKTGDLGPEGNLLPGALGDYGCASGSAGDGDEKRRWTGPTANGPIIVADVRKRDKDLVLEWVGRTRLADLGDDKSYKIFFGDKHVPRGKFGEAAAGDSSLYNGANSASSARVAGPGHGLSPAPDAPFLENFGSYHLNAVCQFGMADGSYRAFTPDVDVALLARMVDRHARVEK